jgi:hypothetical protein
MTLSAIDAINRFKDNEVRVKSFVNDFGAYTTDSGAQVETLRSFMQRKDAEISAAAGMTQYFADYAALRAYTGSLSRVMIADVIGTTTMQGIDGIFIRDDTDTTSADNGGTIIVASNGKRWKRFYEGTPNIKWFGALGDGTDQTSAIAAAASACVRVYVPAGLYVVDSANISRSVTFVCEMGTIFQRKAGADLVSGGYTSFTGMFTVSTNGVDLKFTGAPTFDCNYQNQTTVEPGGCAIKVTVPTTPTSANITVYVEDGRFINGTSDYIMVRGDDVRKRYRTYVTLVRPSFTGGVYGKGKGDPGTPTAVGYTPTYVRVLDYVTLITSDFKARYDGALSLGQYAPVAVWGTYAGSDYTQAGNAQIIMFGRTEIDKMGRAANDYNSATTFTIQNGLGCIDGYGNVDEVYVEDIRARDTYYTPVRAKGSCRVYVVHHADLQNCWRGLEVSPSSTGPCQTVVHVGKVTCRDGTMPQLYFVGTASNDQLYSVDIDSAYCFGTQTNPEALVNSGNAMFKNAAKITVRGLTVIGSPSNGVVVDTVDRAFISEFVANNSTGNAVRVYGTGQFVLEEFDIRNCGAQAIDINTGMTSITIRAGKIDTCVDYGFVNFSTVANVHVQNVAVSNVSGLSRGFYNAGGYVVLLSNIANVGVTTPLFNVSGVIQREEHNSWNPRSVWGTFSTTTAGTWNAGDTVWNNAPTAGGTPGWKCTTSGSPGTFKAMSNLAA